MKKLAVALALLLMACGSGQDTYEGASEATESANPGTLGKPIGEGLGRNESMRIKRQIKLSDGRRVDCIVWDRSYYSTEEGHSGGMHCFLVGEDTPR